jgi:hypothetical protein
MGTRPAASLHRRSTAEGVAGTTMNCATSFTAKMHMVGLKTGTRSALHYDSLLATDSGSVIAALPTLRQSLKSFTDLHGESL